MSNTRSLFITLFLVAVIATVSAMPGDYTPILDVGNPTVQEIAKFAVTEYNKQAGHSLVYDKTLKAEVQGVAGRHYRLIISAKSGDIVGNYEAIVFEGLQKGHRVLTSFEHLLK